MLEGRVVGVLEEGGRRAGGEGGRCAEGGEGGRERRWYFWWRGSQGAGETTTTGGRDALTHRYNNESRDFQQPLTERRRISSTPVSCGQAVVFGSSSGDGCKKLHVQYSC